jgi:rhodanese-related sulfurtransferase
MKTISTIELRQHLAAEPGLTLLDVRTPEEFLEVHVPQARNVPLDELQPDALSLPKEQPVYLICRTHQRSFMAAEEFERHGFTQLVVVEGGTMAWVQANLPIACGADK